MYCCVTTKCDFARSIEILNNYKKSIVPATMTVKMTYYCTEVAMQACLSDKEWVGRSKCSRPGGQKLNKSIGLQTISPSSLVRV